MKRLLLVAAITAVMSQEVFAANANTVVVRCPAGYSSVRGKCQKLIGPGGTQRLVGPGGTQQALPANVNAQFVRPAMNTRGGIQPVAKPAMNTRGGIQRQNIGGNPATWAPVMNTRGGIQPVAKPAMNTRGGIQPVAKPIINTQGGVRRMTGNKAGGSY